MHVLNNKKKQFDTNLKTFSESPETTRSSALGTQFPRKKIYIITSKGGGGHLAAALAIQKSLEKYFTVIVEEPFSKLSGETLFNRFQQQGRHFLIKILTRMQPLAEKIFCPLQVKSSLVERIESLQPDLIISCFPVANSLTLGIAQQQGIPMMVVPTDLEVRHFFNDIHLPGPGFTIGLPFEDNFLKDQLTTHFEQSNIVVTGYPIRQEFTYSDEQLQPHIQRVRAELGIQEGDNVFMIMMGAQGVGKAVYDLTKKLALSATNHDKPLHIISLCGKNEKLLAETRKIGHHKGKNPLVTVHALPSRPGIDISALMSISKGIATKPGGSTVNEAMAKNLYMLLNPEGIDSVFWEGQNLKFAQEKGCAEAIDFKNFAQQAEAVVLDPKKAPIKNCPARQFFDRMPQQVNKIVQDKESYLERKMHTVKMRLENLQQLEEAEPGLSHRLLDFLLNPKRRKNVQKAFLNKSFETVMEKIFKKGMFDEETLQDLNNSIRKIAKDGTLNSIMLQAAYPIKGQAILRKLINTILHFLYKLTEHEKTLQRNQLQPNAIFSTAMLSIYRAYAEKENIEQEHFIVMIELMGITLYNPEMGQKYAKAHIPPQALEEVI